MPDQEGALEFGESKVLILQVCTLTAREGKGLASVYTVS